MSHLPTEADVAYLLKARKFIYKTIKDNTKSSNDVPEIRVIYDIRRKDQPNLDLVLRMSARLERPVIVTGPRPTTGLSLTWHGKRIRGISRRLKHDVIRNGLVIGRVRGWYEHQWTDTDEDKFIIDINSEVQQIDFWSLIKLGLGRWNIECPPREQLRLGE